RLAAGRRPAERELPPVRTQCRAGGASAGETLVEGVAGAAHGTDRILRLAAIDGLAQATDMHVDRPFVDIDVTAPDAVEQLLAREHPARGLHQELEQAELGRP